MEHLTAYLTRHDITQAVFAEKIGTTQSVVSKLCTGVIRPSLDRALRIDHATNGEVPVSAWARLDVQMAGE